MNEAALAADEKSMERDPRGAPFGFYSGGSFALDHTRVFSWFETIGDMANFLLEIEPAIYGIDGEDLVAYRERVMPLVQRLKTQGFSMALLEELNAAVKQDYVLVWWGHFDELVAARTEFASQLIEEYLDGDARPLEADELDGFIEYLKTCGC